jgi:general secretion pathway protein K
VTKIQKNRKAAVLVVVVYIVAVLSMLAWAHALRSRMAIRQGSLLLERLQQEQLALAACDQARLVLEQDDPNVDSLDEQWHSLHQFTPTPADQRGANIDTGSWCVTWKLTDLSARINVNLAGAELLVGLNGLDEAAVAGILDWIDADDITGPDGAESDFYRALQSPYKCKNAPLDCIDELLLIKGISPQIFYAPAQSQFPNDQQDAAGPADLLTTYGDGRININNAAQQVLQALPILSYTAVDHIIARQNSAQKFTSIRDIQDSANFDIAEKLVLIQAARFNTNHFRLDIAVQKKARPLPCRFVAIIERRDQNTGILAWRRKSRCVIRQIPEPAATGSLEKYDRTLRQ